MFKLPKIIIVLFLNIETKNHTHNINIRIRYGTYLNNATVASMFHDSKTCHLFMNFRPSYSGDQSFSQEGYSVGIALSEGLG
jgi:hypothetical protein